MSLGIAVGDFIAAGDLGWRLYRQVYRVARDAPEEVQALRRVLSETADVIRIVNEDLQLPDSPIARLGPERVSLASRIADETNRILKELEKLLEKTDLLSLSSTGARASQRAFWQRNWQKLRYAKDARHMNELRAKVGRRPCCVLLDQDELMTNSSTIRTASSVCYWLLATSE